MKKVSVASVPPIFEPLAREDINQEGNVYCQGLTAKLHSRFGSSESDKQSSRLRKESRMPPIPSARSSTSSRKTSSSRENDGSYPYTPKEKDRELNKLENRLTIVGETGYLTSNFRKKSTAEKLSDTSFQLYTLEDSKKLPKILKPKKKVGRGSKRKKIKDDQSTASNESQLNTSQLDDAKDGNKANLEDSDMSEEMTNKYGLDLKKEFNMEMTRPFTFSYFPQIYSRNKKDKNKETRNNNNKVRKISQIETKTTLY